MGKSINKKLSGADIELLTRCCNTFREMITGNPAPILDLMRATRRSVTENNHDSKFIAAMGVVARLIRSDTASPTSRKRQLDCLGRALAKIGRNAAKFEHDEAMILREATDIHVRFALGQYDNLTSVLTVCGFNTLSHGVDWESLSKMRLDGVGINHELVPDEIRQIRLINREFSELSRDLQERGLDSPGNQI